MRRRVPITELRRRENDLLAARLRLIRKVDSPDPRLRFWALDQRLYEEVALIEGELNDLRREFLRRGC